MTTVRVSSAAQLLDALAVAVVEFVAAGGER
jgi:hypothetical protein